MTLATGLGGAGFSRATLVLMGNAPDASAHWAQRRRALGPTPSRTAPDASACGSLAIALVIHPNAHASVHPVSHHPLQAWPVLLQQSLYHDRITGFSLDQQAFGDWLVYNGAYRIRRPSEN